MFFLSFSISFGETFVDSDESLWIAQSTSCPSITSTKCMYLNDGNRFIDVDKEHYYYDPVCWASNKEITSGTSKNIFSPMDNCSRAQVVTFLWRTMEKPDVLNSNKIFKDITDPDKYYYDAVNWAVQNSITQGTEANLFSPDETVTRAQFVTFLWRTAGCPTVVADNPFQDVSIDGSYYSPAVLWAVQNGITQGTDETHFSPVQPCNRAQVVSFLYRADGTLKGAITEEEFASFFERVELTKANWERYFFFSDREFGTSTGEKEEVRELSANNNVYVDNSIVLRIRDTFRNKEETYDLSVFEETKDIRIGMGEHPAFRRSFIRVNNSGEVEALEVLSNECEDAKGEVLVATIPDSEWVENKYGNCLIVETKEKNRYYLYQDGSVIGEEKFGRTTIEQNRLDERYGFTCIESWFLYDEIKNLVL